MGALYTVLSVFGSVAPPAPEDHLLSKGLEGGEGVRGRGGAGDSVTGVATLRSLINWSAVLSAIRAS